MKVLFINPSRTGMGNIPLNMPLLIAILRRHNHQVRLFDFSDYEVFDDQSYNDLFFKKAALDKKAIIRDRRDFYKAEFGKTVFEDRLKSSDYRTDFENLLEDFRPDIVAVSCLTVDFIFISQFLMPLKQRYKTPVVFGGIHAILLPEETLRSPACDFVCTGEGEGSFSLLLDAIENNRPLEGVKGIWFKNDAEIVKNSPITLTDLKTLPIPDFSDFDPIHFYRPFDGKRYKMLNYELSRGCPFDCTYCVNGVLKAKYKGLGSYHRIKGISQSIGELRSLVDRYNFEFIRFWDEDFTSINTGYLQEYAAAYIKEINLPFLIYARVDTLTERKVEIIKRMGCRTFAMGIENGNELIRRHVLNRRISNRDIVEKFNLVKSYNMRVSAYNIIGVPQETRETVFDTIDLNREVDPDSFSVTFLEPYKGTPIRKMCEEQGLDPNHETVYNNKAQFIPKSMTEDELNGLFRTFRFYVRFPKNRYREIELAERDDAQWKRLNLEYIQML